MRVAVYKLGGELQLEVPPESTGGDLKRLLEVSDWHVPAACQKLLCGTLPLEDKDRLKDQLMAFDPPGDRPLCVNLVVSVSELIEDLDHRNCHRRQVAVETLGEFGPRAGHLAVAGVVNCLEDWDAAVREVAIKALAQLAPPGDDAGADLPGDKTVVEAVLVRLTHDNWRVRCAAIEALAGVTAEGSQVAIDSVARRLADDPDEDVRQTAAEVLARVACRGDTKVCSTLVSHMRDDALSKVRCAAIGAFSRVAALGDRDAVRAVLERLEDDNEGVRRAAAAALPRLAGQGGQADGDEHVVDAVRECLQHQSARVRCAAIEALAQLVEQGCASAASASAALVERLGDEDDGVRCAAARTLPSLAARGEEAVCTAVIEHARHHLAEVRRSAIQALAGVATRGDARATAAVLECLQDDIVRLAAFEALPHLVEKSDEAVVEAVAGYASHSDAAVRCAAMRTLARIIVRGDDRAMAAVRERLPSGDSVGDCDDTVLLTAVDVLPSICTRNDEALMAAVGSLLSHQTLKVRVEANKALARLLMLGEPSSCWVASLGRTSAADANLGDGGD